MKERKNESETKSKYAKKSDIFVEVVYVLQRAYFRDSIRTQFKVIIFMRFNVRGSMYCMQVK